MSGFAEEIERVLRECQETGELVAIHRWDDEPDIFIVGFVREIEGDWVYLRYIDSDGEEDPDDRPTPISHIVRVHRGSAYLRGLRTLYDQRGKVYSGEDGVESAGAKALPKLLKGAYERELPVRLTLKRKEKVTGFVRRLGNDFLALEVIVEGGEPDGLLWLPVGQIKRVRLNTKGEQAEAFLYRNREGPKG